MRQGQPDELFDFKSMSFKVCKGSHEVAARACPQFIKMSYYLALPLSQVVGKLSYGKYLVCTHTGLLSSKAYIGVYESPE